MFKTHRTYDLTTGVKNNTIAIMVSPKRLAVLYHETEVITKIGRTITLNNGGLHT